MNQIKDKVTVKAIRAVVLVGNPLRTPNLKSDFDTNGGQTESRARGLQAGVQAGLSSSWDISGKVLDVCAPGDGVCDSATGTGISYAHLAAYPASNWLQSTALKLIVNGVSKA